MSSEIHKSKSHSDFAFNREMLTLARESRGLTQSRLAKLLNTTQGRISKIENGMLLPQDKLVSRLSKMLDYPESFFYQHGPVFGLPISFYRRRKTLPKKVLDRVTAEMNIRRTHIEHMLRSAEIQLDRNIPFLDIDEYEGDTEEIARVVRIGWKLPSGPIKNLVEAIENAGGIIIPCDFESDRIDAVSQRLTGLPPMIFVNTSTPTDRIRFSVAHELGHLVMHEYPTPNMEDEANRFAAEFLMPQRDINSYFKTKLSLRHFAALKPVWRVSMAALLKRAKDLGRISEKSYSYFWLQMGKSGWRRREPPELDLEPERPTLLNELIKYHTDQLEYNVDELAIAVNEYPHNFQKKYFSREPHLRLVK